MTLRSIASLLLLASLACGPETKNDSTATDTADTGTAGDTHDTSGTPTGTAADTFDTTGTPTGTAADTFDTTAAETGTGELPPNTAEVCAAACAKFESCADDPASFDTAECMSDCEAGIVFLGTNNPGTDCAETELGRQDCLSMATCEEIEAYVSPDDPPNQVCQEWDEKLGDCAIE